MSTASRVRDVLLGLTAMALALVMLVVAYLAYDRALVPATTVTLRTGVVGNQLQVGSDVKLNGVPVGRVSQIDATEDGAELSLALDPDTMHLLPDDVVARLLPKTLFGERYVALVDSDSDSADSEQLEAGDVIVQDPSAEAAELQEVLDELLPVLQAIQPDKLSAMMGELADMLRGNGQDLGDAMVAWGDYVDKLNPKVPAMTDDLARLATVAEEWNVAAPDLVDALATMTSSTQLLVDEQTSLKDVYASVIGTADTATGWVADNEDTIVVLSRKSRAALRATAPYASQFPCLFKAVANYVPKMDKVLGEGSDEPGVHAVLQVVPARTKYLKGVDDVTYTKGNPAPRCPYVTGEVGTSAARQTAGSDDGSGDAWPASTENAGAENAGAEPAGDEGDEVTGESEDPPAIEPPPGTTAESYVLALTGLGDANSPGENQLIAELVAPTQGMAPSDYPLWNSLLLGPTLRGTKVVLK